MPSDRTRLAFVMTLLMAGAPLASAGVSNWSGPTYINSDGDPTLVNGFSIPSNATVLDGWVHVTNSPLSSSTDLGIAWDEDDFVSGNLLGLEMNEEGEMVLKDDGSRSNVSTFDVGEIEVTLNQDYKYSPGWRRVFTKGEFSSDSGCNDTSGTYVRHGLDNDFDQLLDDEEIIETMYFCQTFANEDVVTSLSIDDRGDGYAMTDAGNLTASGGGGSGFSGTYAVSSGIESITVSSGGSGYDVGDQVIIQCQCDGTGAQASVGSVDGSNAIVSVDIDSPGSGYQSSDNIILTAVNGSGATLSANVFSTGVIHSVEINDGGANYTATPDILISDSSGSGGEISASLGAYYNYEVNIVSENHGENCPLSGFRIDIGLDMDGNRNLDSSEVSDSLYICHSDKLWRATTFLDLNGTVYGGEQTLSHGVVPSSSSQGIVSAGTMPGQPVPAGTSGYLIIPAANVPKSEYISTFYMTFDHWYHLDSTSSGGGDGTWVEYRFKTEDQWGNWTYVEPQGGYPSTISNDAPIPNGATSPVAVFASDSHSGWVSSNFSISSLEGVLDADKVQFRFHIWTHPNASTERPGWFIDNVEIINEGVDLDVWHHGCFTATSTSCTYNSNANGAIERIVDLSGTNSTSKIELNMEWDLEGGNADNACVELSLNGNTWADISSGASSTSSACSSRTTPIPGNGYTADNGVSYQDQSGDLRLVSLDIPSSFQNQAAVYLRVVVDTSPSVNYGGNLPSDNREGLTLSHIRVIEYDGNVLFSDDFGNSASMSDYGILDDVGNPSPNDWIHRVLSKGFSEVSIGFEDSSANSPTVNDAPGWSRSQSGSCSSDKCRFTLNKVSSNSGPSAVSSFPYAYGVGFSGNYEVDIDQARLISPTYQIPQNGSSFLTFDHWSCSESGWDGGTVFIKVNGGTWQHFDPGWYTDTASGSSGHSLQGMEIWSMEHCTGNVYQGTWSSTSAMTNMVANLDAYKGDSVKFKFAFGADSYYGLAGWFIDNAGVKISNFGVPGQWISPTISMDSEKRFNMGFVDIEAYINQEGWVRGSILEANSGMPISGFSNISFPFSLAGIDAEQYPQIKLKVHMGSDNPEETPRLVKVHMGGKRVLSAGYGQNGWDFSAGIEVIDGLLNATAVTGAITSDFIHSSRPIKSVSIQGNVSSTVSVSVFDAWGNSLGTASKGGNIQFSTQQVGFSLSITLPTNGWIDILRISSTFSNPPSNTVIDILDDSVEEWSFPSSHQSSNSGYGHLGWQSSITLQDSFSRSSSLSLDGTNPETVTILIPESASVNSGIFAISPDSDGFEAPVTVSIAGSSVSGGSGASPFVNAITPSQITAISLLSASHTDSQTGRQWVEIPFSVSSTASQSVSLTSVGLGYQFFENISNLGNSVGEYLGSITLDATEDEVDIPISVTSDYGSISVDGSIVYDFMFVNRDFNVPNTLYPDGNLVEVITRHHHLFDNSEIADITLIGSASDGNSINYKVENSADGLWGSGSGSPAFSQSSGNQLAPLDLSSSYVAHSEQSDGYTDIEVHWMFSIDWNWDDVDEISWVASANDANGFTIWPATAESGSFGENAVENDLQIDSFEVRDENGRLISNSDDTLFYPFPILGGSDLNISGSVRFQDAGSKRPLPSDFSVALSISGAIYPLDTGAEGSFSGVVSALPGVSSMTLSPEILRVGPSSSTNGAEDVTGTPPEVDIEVDSNPPIAGAIEVQTPVGLQPADGMVIPPSVPFSPFITISEAEARGESLTLRYWREGIDDDNGDGIADESEYESQERELSQGLTGEQQVQFVGIDVSDLENEQIHLYVEGTDWAGLSYQEGGTGGGPGASNSWASIVVAEDVMVEFAGAGFGSGSGGGSTFYMDRVTQDSIDYFLIPGTVHTFKVRLDEPNGFRTIDNITVYLCGYGSELGVFSYDPYTATIWSPEGSMLTPIGSSTEAITASVTELSVRFSLSWDMPFSVEDNDCKPRVLVQDGLDQIESDVLSSLSWRLDNRISAVPDAVEDLTEPIVPAPAISLFLGQGDQFSVSGSIFHQGSGIRMSQAIDGLNVLLSMTYGSGNYESTAEVDSDGNFSVQMTLPNFQPINPTTVLTTTLLNTPGLSQSVPNSDATATVDTKRPTALFDLVNYPDSSLTVLETDKLDEVLVTITIVEEIGMVYGPLQVSWVFERNGQPISGTESNGEISWLSSNDGRHVYQGELDFTPVSNFNIIEGDRVSFWITSTDNAGNTVAGLGGPDSPRTPTIRIVEFLGQYTREVITPTKNPLVGDTITIVTYWENPGKNEGTISVGLYEQRTDGTWQPSISTMINGPIELILPPGSSSVKAEFEYQTWSEGQPLLVLVVDEDFANDNYLNVEISGIEVAPAAGTEQSGDAMIWLAGALVLVISLMGLAFFVIRRGGGEYDYYEEYEDEYEEDY